MQEYNIIKKIDIKLLYTAFEVFYDGGFSFDGESHDFWEIVYVIDGVAEVSADGKVYRLGGNQIIFHKPMEFHKLWTPQGEQSHLFIASFIADGDAMDELKDGVFSLNEQQREQMLYCINRFRSASANTHHTKPSPEYISHIYDTPYFSQLVGNCFETLFLMLLEDSKKVPALRHNGEVELYQRIIRFMQDNICGHISLPELARECSISVSTLKNIFSRYSGYGVHKYFVKLKINKAIELLKQGKSVSLISEELGYNNPNYFSFAFKRETGYSPREYIANPGRRQNLNTVE